MSLGMYIRGIHTDNLDCAIDPCHLLGSVDRGRDIAKDIFVKSLIERSAVCGGGAEIVLVLLHPEERGIEGLECFESLAIDDENGDALED